MTAVLLDTHAWAWSLSDDPRLSVRAAASIADADAVMVSPVSFFEIAQKVRLGRWPEMAPFLERLPALLEEQGGRVAALEPGICLTAGTMDWAHRDPFDRFLAATALRYRVAIVSADAAFDGVVRRVW